MIRNSPWTSLLEIGSKELLQKPMNLGVSLRRRPCVTEGVWDWMELASGCSRTLIQTSSEKRQLRRVIMSVLTYQEILRKEKKSLSRKTSLLDLFKLSSTIRASPPVLLLVMGDDDSDDARTVHEEDFLLKFSFLVCHIVCEILLWVWIYFLLIKTTCL